MSQPRGGLFVELPVATEAPRPELGRVPASLKLCNLYKPRGQFVYQPGKDPTPKRKRASPAKILKRTESGEMEEAAPPPAVPTLWTTSDPRCEHYYA